MKHQIALLFALIAFGPELKASEWYAAPNAGGTGNGSITNPWPLSLALKTNSIQAGDTLWLRGGTYASTNVPSFKSMLIGTSNNPIIVRQYPGERAILDGNATNNQEVLDVEGSYTWWWDFEVMNSNTNRHTTGGANGLRGDGIQMNGTYAGNGNKLINLIIHDNCDGIFLAAQSTNAEITGCIIYNNGYQAADKGHGHDVYLQNKPNAGTKVCRDNVMLNCFSTGMHLYGQAGQVCGINVLNNIVYGSGTPSTYGAVENVDAYSAANIDNIVFGGNVGFTTGSQNWMFGWEGITNQGPTGSIIVTNNLSVAGSVEFYFWTNAVCSNNIIQAVWNGSLRYWFFTNTETVVSDYNTFYGPGYGFQVSTLTNGVAYYVPFATWQAMGYDTHSTLRVGVPTIPTVVIQKNPYESGRAHIAIANWATNDNVSVDVSGVLSTGMTYEVRNASDYFGPPVASGVYGGGTIPLPMTNLSVAVPIGMQTAPAPTGPLFNAFVLIKTNTGAGVLYGDVNSDGSVTAYDAALAAQAAVGLVTLTSQQQQAADVDGNGKVTAYDAALIAQRAVGLISKFPVEP